jgi:Ni2+-binding GTPase involved in maturation of urease and hydrogenase
MDLHLISGFLGSGKTTAIVHLSKMLMRTGLKVGVITNDQGKYLVDTAFINAEDIPAVDVQSGCFCSHLDDLLEQIEHLRQKIDPDLIFAESIGTAGNLVGTVVQPLLNGTSCFAKSLSVLTDARLLLRFCQGLSLPFSDSVCRLYKGQINESDILIVNKIDLVTESDIALLKKHIPEIFPGKFTLFQSAFNEDNIAAWYRFISGMQNCAQLGSGLDDRVKRLAIGRFRWYEKAYEFSHAVDIHDMLLGFLEKLLRDLERVHCAIGHIKCFIRTENDRYYKVSILTFDDVAWKTSLSPLHARYATLIMNARILTDEPIDHVFP